MESLYKTLFGGGEKSTLEELISIAKQINPFKERVYEFRAQPKATPNPTPQPKIKDTKDKGSEELARKIIMGLRTQLGKDYVPAEQYVNQFVDATNRYPIFKNNPYLLP